jgi:hypothetical protein
MRYGKIIAGFGLVAIMLAATARAAVAKDRYFMVVFSAQNSTNSPRAAHTWATFIKASGAGAFPRDYKIESHTISWLPASMAVVPVRLRPEPGKNLDLKATFKWVKSVDAHDSAWGPYQIQKGLYERALAQIQALNSGKIAYKAIDLRFRGRGATNCIHAVADIDVDSGLLETGTQFGDAAGELVVRHLQRWLVDPKKTYPALMEKLALGKVEINYRRLSE